MDIDLLKSETHIDPWPTYDWMRENAPVYWDATNEIWAVTRYADIIAVSRDAETFISGEGNRPKMPGEPNFINMDGKAHMQRRSLVQDLFTPKAVATAEGFTREVCIELLDKVADKGECEFVDDISAPLPLRLIATMLGDPPEVHDRLSKWMDIFTKGGQGPEYVTEEVQETFMEFAAHHFDEVEKREGCPAHDILSMWMNAGKSGCPMDEEAVLFEHVMLLVGGSETTRNAITGGLMMLMEHPEQWDYLVEHPEGIPNACEEMIRWVSPFINMTRTVSKDTVFNGVELKEDDEIMMMYPAANRDPRAFDDPHTFNIHREFGTKDKKPIAFGYGRHHCLGAHIARLEMHVMFEQIFKRWKSVRMNGEPEYRISSFIRGVKHLPIAFELR
ncbi:MAG: cytochrome P450 [Proteobacteria bacterium]|nr:cytochrome P450 [Pseudomonadota bacterium]MCP4922131.1 cytochrome P450 [Pseudomonadota bacterium]